MDLILADVDWTALARKIRVETKNREVYQPLISVYRWWARRPHSLMGALIDAASPLIGKGACIADPFSGGGTVAIETARRGYRVYAQDINPWAAWGLKVSLTPVNPEELRAAGKTFLEKLGQIHRDLYATRSRQHGTETLAHAFRVHTGSCRHCECQVWFFPYAMLTLASRGTNERYAYFGCRKCGAVSRHRVQSKRQHCYRCGFLLHRGNHPTTYYAEDNCPHCRNPGALRDRKRAHNWDLVLVQRLREADGRKKLVIELPTTRDRETAEVPDLELPNSLAQEIPVGIETSRLVRAGFSIWADLYPARQLHVLLSAAKTLGECAFPKPIRDRLALCIVGAAEMPGHLCRWDRFHPKVFEALSNHRYSFDGLAVEPNPLSPLGRGSLHRRIKSSIRAAEWLRDRIAADNVVAYVRAAAGEIGSKRTSIVQGSSERQLLGDGEASLVITDPPYFDSVQYGELAALFLTWMTAIGIDVEAGRFNPCREAVPNRVRKTNGSNYLDILKSIFRECGRTLAEEGRLILTYHSTNLRAWAALGTALASTGFRVVGLSVVSSENASDHSKRGTRAFTTDLLIECIKTDEPLPVQVVRLARTPEERELLHVGLAIAEAGTRGYAKVRELFVRRSCRMRNGRIVAPAAPINDSPRDTCPTRKKRERRC
jgi:adenine-specific DNA methylase